VLKFSAHRYVQYIRVGWFWTFFSFSTKVPLRFLHNFQKTENSKNYFWPSDLFILGHGFLGQLGIQIIFLSQYGLHGYPKTPNFTYSICLKYKLTLVIKCT
jgi:hypothetical protein